MFLRRVLAAGAIVLASAMAANAADINMVPEPMSPEIMTPVPAFHWGGGYVGAYGGYMLGPNAMQAGAQAGYNFVSGNLLLGAELQAGAIFAGPAVFDGGFNLRAGKILGTSILLYAETGIGTIGFGTFTYAFGGGAEFAVGNAASLFVETKGLGSFGGGCCAIAIQTGLNWHL